MKECGAHDVLTDKATRIYLLPVGQQIVALLPNGARAGNVADQQLPAQYVPFDDGDGVAAGQYSGDEIYKFVYTLLGSGPLHSHDLSAATTYLYANQGVLISATYTWKPHDWFGSLQPISLVVV